MNAKALVVVRSLQLCGVDEEPVDVGTHAILFEEEEVGDRYIHSECLARFFVKHPEAKLDLVVSWLRQPPLDGVYVVSGTLGEYLDDPQPMCAHPFQNEDVARTWWHAEALKPGNETMPGLKN